MVAPGMYTMSVIRTEDFIAGVADYYIEKPMYSDMNDNVEMQLEITEQAFKSPMPSIILEPKDWTPDLSVPPSGPITPSFYTGRIPGARIQNHINSVHSFSTYTQSFTGILEIWATLVEAPNSSNIPWLTL